MTEDHQRGEGDDVSIAGGELLKKERGFSGSSFNGDASRASIPARPGAYGRLDAQIQILLEVNRNTAAAVKSLNIERLQEAIAFAEESADACSEFSVIRSDVLDNLGWARRVMYEETAQEEYLGKAVEAFEEAVNICPPDFPGRSRIVSNFACVLKIRFEANANVEDLDRGIALEEVTLAVSDAAERSRRSGNLASSLRRRFGVSANFADFERSIALTEESVKFASSAQRPARLRDLGESLITRFQNIATFSDLEKGVALLEEALNLARTDEDRRECLAALGSSLRTRFAETRDIADLNQSIVLLEAALQLCPPTHIDRPHYLHNLAVSLSDRFLFLKNIADLDRNVDLYEEVLALFSPNSTNRGTCLYNKATSLDTRFDLHGNAGDLDKSIALLEQVLELYPTTHISRYRCLNKLARSLLKRCKHAPDTGDLDKSIHLAQSAVKSLPLHHPHHSECVETLSLSQLQHIQEKHRQDCNHVCDYSVLKVDDVICQLRNAVNSPHCPSDSRLVISLSWVKASIEFHRESLFDAYTAMYDALDVVITRGHSLASRYNQLTTRQDIAKAKAHFTDAVHFAVTDNRPRDAVIFLERGRSLLLAQVGHCRMPLDYVKEKDADLAAQLESIGRQLDRLLGCDTKSADSTSRSVANDATIQFMRLTARWNALVEDARRLDGCSDFLKPTRFESLQQGASGGPVVFINVTESSSHAVVVVSVGDPLIIPLPDATPTQIDKLTSVLLDTRDKQARTFTLALRDLWDIIIGPVVDHVKPLVPIRSRIWWCPSASVAELPLHAAGHYYKGADSDKRLPHLFVSSYTSSLGALIRARRATPQHLSSAPNLLVISQPDTKGEIELNVRDEITSISRKLSDTTVLEGPDGTPDAIATAIPNHSWVHFSCHAYAVSDNPLRSHFILHEGHLQVLDILRIQNPDAELAVLTACHTAGAGTSAPEEFLHLAGAMQFTGFRSVIGTLWKMDDGDGSFVVKELYRQLFEALDKGNRLAYTCAAEALQDTVWKLRTERKAEPWRWANYVHYGA